jgi:thiol-disulfide isomerase/thioredoxin
VLAVFSAASLAFAFPGAAQGRLIHAELHYRAPGGGQPAPNFSPKGTQVPLADVSAGIRLPAGAQRPARTGMIEVGPDTASWIPVLATASSDYPDDLTQVFLDRNRDGNFVDDGPALQGVPNQNLKTRAWWTSINKVELSVPYGGGVVEPYFVNFWMVRDDSASVPDILRYSVGSWREGTVVVDGVEALVAAMDGDNNAIFDQRDSWSAMAASEPNAAKAVLSIAEARPTNRLMFLEAPGKEIALEFRSFSPDGRGITFAVIDAPVTKAADRAPDDMLRDERSRPRTTVPVVWGHGSPGFEAGLERAGREGKMILLDFEATWCGPCHTMDEWIWTDADVAARLNSAFVGVKIDVDLEKGLVGQFKTSGYPTMIILDSHGKELRRVTEYQSSRHQAP